MTIWMPVCTSCSQTCELGSSYIAVVEREGELGFVWGCEHRPIGDAVAYFGSQKCMLDWLTDRPDAFELTRRYARFISRRRAVTNCQLH